MLQTKIFTFDSLFYTVHNILCTYCASHATLSKDLNAQMHCTIHE